MKTAVEEQPEPGVTDMATQEMTKNKHKNQTYQQELEILCLKKSIATIKRGFASLKLKYAPTVLISIIIILK